MTFANREEAGKQLASALAEFKDRSDVVVYALPRGGVPIGIEVAKSLHLQLDLLVPRKIGHPQNPEYALCAIDPEGDMVCADENYGQTATDEIKKIIAQEKKEAERRIHKYLLNRNPISVTGKTALVVDDGIATGLTMRAAVLSVKHRQPKEIVVAVPVVSDDVARQLEAEGIRVVAILREQFYAGAVASYYDEFAQVEDEDVIRIMRQLKYP